MYVWGRKVPTETLHLGKSKGSLQPDTSSPNSECHSPAPRMWHTFFVPGNPGCLWYYLPWLQEVQTMQQEMADQVHGKGAVQVMLHALSHANHHFTTTADTDAEYGTGTGTNDVDAGNRVTGPAASTSTSGASSRSSKGLEHAPFEAYGLAFQIEHTRAFVAASLCNYSTTATTSSSSSSSRQRVLPLPPMLSFIGHSIGAYCVLDLLDVSSQFVPTGRCNASVCLYASLSLSLSYTLTLTPHYTSPAHSLTAHNYLHLRR